VTSADQARFFLTSYVFYGIILQLNALPAEARNLDGAAEHVDGLITNMVWRSLGQQ
jgi:hypothetical protein